MKVSKNDLLEIDESLRVNPHRIPCRKLSSGASMPAIGMGTFGSDHVSAEQVAEAVLVAASIGYRHFDCAEVYANEAEVGQSLQTALGSGIDRSELWVTSKLWNNHHDPADVEDACKASLHNLGLDYLDLYLVHWPFPNFHPPHCDVSSRSPDAKPYIHENFMRTWAAMERLVERGWVKHIGTSNMTIPKLDLLLRDCSIRPAVNEMELHPHFQQPELFAYVIKENIVPVGYSPIGSPARPERDRTPEDTADIEDPVLVEIARKHGIHPATLCVKWAEQRGQIPIPFSKKARNLSANIQALLSPSLTEEEMKALEGIDRGCRLIKGHVFLWRDGQDWQDLWDLNNTLIPAKNPTL